MDKLNEECGVFGIIDSELFNAAGLAQSALLALQHRGQEGAGVAYFDHSQMSYPHDSQLTYINDAQLLCYKGLGLVNDVFTEKIINNFSDSFTATSHVRYAPNALNSLENTQPIITNHSLVSYALSHNGSITNAKELRDAMVKEGRVFHTTNDSEILNKIIMDEFIISGDIEKSVFKIFEKVEGAYSIVIITQNKLIALRDKNGFRPLCIGKRGSATIVSSESCAIEAVGGDFVRDVLPGELISFDTAGNEIKIQSDVSKSKKGLCIFEYVYFARPDSFIDGVSVYNARMEMGKALARQRFTDADIVCGVPDSGLDAAYGFHLQSGIAYGQAFVKNRYCGRSFIIPNQLARENLVNIKLTPLRASIEGKRVILVDDSIVRGTTSAKIIQQLKKAGAKEVHLRISSPPFKYQCYFGTDIDSRENLIANKLSIDEICKQIDADSLEFLSLENLRNIRENDNTDYCMGCFSGDYPIKINS